MSPAQIRAARALLGWSQSDLASATGISDRTVKRLEALSDYDEIVGTRPAAEAIQTTLQAAGIRFISRAATSGVVLHLEAAATQPAARKKK